MDWLNVAQDRDSWQLRWTAMEFGLHKMQGISWLAVELSAVQGNWSMKLFVYLFSQSVAVALDAIFRWKYHSLSPKIKCISNFLSRCWVQHSDKASGNSRGYEISLHCVLCLFSCVQVSLTECEVKILYCSPLKRTALTLPVAALRQARPLDVYDQQSM